MSQGILNDRQHLCSGSEVELPCGCAVRRCVVCGGAYSLRKCEIHAPQIHESRKYYCDDMWGILNGIPQHRRQCSELEVAMKEAAFSLPYGGEGKTALEVGAGLGLYAPFLMQRGYAYEAVEMDAWASAYVRSAYYAVVHSTPFESFNPGCQWDVIVAAHVLEHFKDSPRMLLKMEKLLKPGGYLIIVIPDDTDLCNPDHYWFYTEAAIRGRLEELGFQCVRTLTKQVVAHEKFIYAFARKRDSVNEKELSNGS